MLKIVAFLALLLTACATHFVEVNERIVFSKSDNQTGSYRCISPNGRFIAKLNQDAGFREIIAEDVSTPFRSTVLVVRQNAKLDLKVSERFKNQIPIDQQVAESLLEALFPESLDCCSYVTKDGFFVSRSKTVGVKILDSHRIFRIYREGRPILDITILGNGFEIAANGAVLKCIRDLTYEQVY